MSDIEKKELNQTAVIENDNWLKEDTDWYISHLQVFAKNEGTGQETGDLTVADLDDMQRHLADRGIMSPYKRTEEGVWELDDESKKIVLGRDFRELFRKVEDNEERQENLRDAIREYLWLEEQKRQELIDAQKVEKGNVLQKIVDKVLNTLRGIDPKRIPELVFRTAVPLIYLSACQTITEAKAPVEVTPISSSVPEDIGEETENTSAYVDTVETEEATQTPEVTPTEIPTPTPTPQPEIDPQEFDYTMLDLMQWEGDWEVSDIEKHKPGYIVEVREGYKTMLYAAPLYDKYLESPSYFYGLHEFEMPEGFNFELLETRKITGEDGRNVTIGILRNAGATASTEGAYAIVLSAENERGERIDFTTEQSEAMATASIADFGSNLPFEDQEAAMLLLRNILKYQQEHGPFLAGQTYSLREVADMQTDEFQRLFYYPDGTNPTLDQTVGTITNLLVNESKIAVRTPEMVENGRAFVSLNTVIDAREIYGTRLKRGSATGDVPENDVILTFVEGPNGEKSYYIDGDVMENTANFFLSFYLKDNLSDEDIAESIAEVDEIYQMYLEWGRTGHPFTNDGILELYKYLYGRLSNNEEELQRMYTLVRKIFPLKEDVI